MADDINLPTPDVKGLKEFNQEAGKSVKIFKQIADHQAKIDLDKKTASGKKYLSWLKMTSKETAHLVDIEKKLNKGMEDWEKNLISAAKAGKRSTTTTVAGMMKLNVTFKESIREAQSAAQEFDKLQAELAKTAVGLEECEVQIKNLNKAIKAGGGDSAKLQADLDKHLARQRELNEVKQTTVTAMEKESVRIQQTTIDTVNAGKALRSYTTEAQQQDRELRKMKGGVGALTVPLEEAAAAGRDKWIEKLTSGATVIAGLAMINKGFTQVGQFYKANAELSMKYNLEMAESFVDSGVSAQNTLTELTRTAGELGFQLEEVQQISNSIRLNVLPRDGKLNEEAVRNLTKEVLYFSKATGVDAAKAAEMVARRTKELGLSAESAQADLSTMRLTLTQMTAGLKNNLVPADEMVDLIEDASRASQAYTVDTRIMTQALRGAANMAAELGANQRLVKDTAKSMGKMITQAGEHIKLPAGIDLVQQMMGDPEGFLKKVPAEMRGVIENIQKGVKSGQIGQYSAAKQLNELLSGSALGQEAIFKQYDRYLNSSEGAALMVSEGVAETAAAAQLALQTLRKAREMQNYITAGGEKFKDITLSTSDFMTGAADKAQGIMKKFQESPSAAVAEMQKALGITEDEAKSILDLQKQYVEGSKEAYIYTAQAIAAMTKPEAKANKMFKMVADLRKQGLSDNEITDKVADKFDLNLEETKKSLAGMIENKAGLDETNQKALYQNLIAHESVSAKEQDEKLKEYGKHLADGVIGAAKHLIHQLLPGLEGPLGNLIAGVGTTIAGAIGLIIGGAGMTAAVAAGTALGNMGAGGIVGSLSKALQWAGGLALAFGGAIATAAAAVWGFVAAQAGVIIPVLLVAGALWALYEMLNAANDWWDANNDTEEISKETAKSGVAEQTAMFAKSYGMSTADYEKARGDAKTQGVSTNKYLESKGFKKQEPSPTAASAPRASVSTSVDNLSSLIEKQATKSNAQVAVKGLPAVSPSQVAQHGTPSFSAGMFEQANAAAKQAMGAGAMPSDPTMNFDPNSVDSSGSVLVRMEGFVAAVAKANRLSVG